jgi:hypothetical protein
MKPSFFLRVAACGIAAGIFSVAGFAQANATSQTNSAAAPNGEEPAKVDLNTADIPTLEAVREIGTDYANAVVAGRPYKSVEDFARALKFTPEKMAALRPKVWVSPPKTAASATTTSRPATPSQPPRANEGKATAAKDVTERYDRAQANKTNEKKEN